MNFNFGIIYQLKTKKFWWMDVVFYFVISLLISIIFCYGIFSYKIYLNNKKTNEYQTSITTVGTDEQKEREKEIFDYQKKIKDFLTLMKDHKFASRVFAFLEQYTMPQVWFNSFSVQEKAGQVSLAGETENMEGLSRQILILEENEYIEKISLLNAEVEESGRIKFNLGISVKPEIFTLFNTEQPESTPQNQPTESPQEQTPQEQTPPESSQ